MNRRNVLKLASTAAIGAFVAPPLTVEAFAASGPSPLSQAVLQTFYQAAGNVYQRVGARTIRQTDIQGLATASQALFGNMAETGWNAAIQAWIPANYSRIANANVGQVASGIAAQLKTVGISVSSQQILQVLSQISDSEKQALAKQFVSSGLASVEGTLISNLKQLAGQAVVGHSSMRQEGEPQPQLIMPAQWCGGASRFAGFLGYLSFILFQPEVGGVFGVIAYILSEFASTGLC